MAENNEDIVLLKVNVDSSEADSSIDKLSNKIGSLNNQDFGTKSVSELKGKIEQAEKAVQELAKSSGILSNEYNEANVELSNMTDEYSKLISASNNFNPDKKLDVLDSSLKDVNKSLRSVENNIKATDSEKQKLFSDNINEKFKNYLENIGGQFGFVGQGIAAAVGEMNKMSGGFGKLIGLFRGQKAATDAATVSTTGFGTALKAIGIGLIISALALLIDQWDNVKKMIDKVIPSFTSHNGILDKTVQVLQGVGNALLKFLITPIKTVISLVQGDFKEALNTIKNGFYVVGNYQSGVNSRLLTQNEKYWTKNLELSINHLEKKKELLNAEGENTEQLQRNIYNSQLKLYEDDKEKYEETLQAKEVFEAGIRKKRVDENKKLHEKQLEEDKKLAEKNKELYDAALKEHVEANKVAKALIVNQNKTELDKELEAVSTHYSDLITKAKKLNQDTTSLEEAKEIELAAIRKKYADIVDAYIKRLDDSKLNSFDAQRKQINDEINELLKNATADESVTLLESKTKQLNEVETLEKATSTVSNKTTNLTIVEDENLIDEAKDTPEVVKEKLRKITDAKLEASNASFELEKLQKQGQQLELEELEANHQATINGILQDATAKQLEIDKAAKEAKLENLLVVADAMNGLGSLMGEHTIAAKGLGVATATMDTYVGATKALAQGGIFGYVGAAGIIATGLANVKKILATKIEGKSTGSSAPNIAPAVAPIINTTVLNGSKEVQDVRVLNGEKQEPIKAYITDRDLNSQRDKSNLVSKLSTY